MNEISNLYLNRYRKPLTEEDENLLKLICLTMKGDARARVLHAIARRRHAFVNIISSFVERRNSLYSAVLNVERHGQFWELGILTRDETYFKECFRISLSSFKILCEKLSGMANVNTNYKFCIPLDKRIAIALYVLKSSHKYSKIARLFGVSKASLCEIFKEFCLKVWQVLGPEYLNSRFLTPEKVAECVEGFEIIGFPQCFGAIDGCHIEVKPNVKKSAYYYNYKGWASMVILALVDYRCRILYLNIGAPGSLNNSEIFDKSTLKIMLEGQSVLKQNTKTINGVNVPVVILGNSDFRFSNYLMKPYSVSADKKENKFNDSLSKARMVADNAFDQLKARFSRIGKGVDCDLKSCAAIIKCCCVLNNFLIEHNDEINEKWIQIQNDYERSKGRTQPVHNEIFDSHDQEAEEIRSAISTYISSLSDVEALVHNSCEVVTELDG